MAFFHDLNIYGLNTVLGLLLGGLFHFSLRKHSRTVVWNILIAFAGGMTTTNIVLSASVLLGDAVLDISLKPWLYTMFGVNIGIMMYIVLLAVITRGFKDPIFGTMHNPYVLDTKSRNLLLHLVALCANQGVADSHNEFYVKIGPQKWQISTDGTLLSSLPFPYSNLSASFPLRKDRQYRLEVSGIPFYIVVM